MEQQFPISAARFRSVGIASLTRGCSRRIEPYETVLMITCDSVRFPGAVNSKFTTDMTFINAKDMPHIPTYRVMDSDGELVDKSRERPVDVSDEDVLTWYKNMLSGGYKYNRYISG